MARILVRATDNTWSPDPLRWRRGMIVDILPDDRDWGPADLANGKHVAIDVPGISAADLNRISETDHGSRLADEHVLPEFGGRRTARRALVLDLDGLTFTNQRVTLTRGQFRARVQRRSMS